MRIAICDDNDQEHTEMIRAIAYHDDGHRLHTYTGVEALVEAFEQGEQFDVLFLAIEMSDGDGWALAKKIKLEKPKLFLIMVSYLEQYIYRCFDRVDWFLTKPLETDKLIKALNMAQSRLPTKSLVFHVARKQYSIEAHDIIYVEVERNLMTIHTYDKVYNLRKPLKQLKAELADCGQFVQINRSILINLRYFQSITEDTITLYPSKVVHLSRNYRKDFLHARTHFSDDKNKP